MATSIASSVSSVCGWTEAELATLAMTLRPLMHRLRRFALGAAGVGIVLAGELTDVRWFTARGDRDEGEAALQAVVRFLEACPEREAGTEAGRQAAEWLAAQLGPRAQVQPFTSGLGLPMANVYLPAAAQPVAILATHFDTKGGIERFVGANDGASTVGLLLHLAREGKLPVAYLFLDGEECRERYSAQDGLQGAWHAARSAELPRVPVIVLDMLGAKEGTPGLATNGSPRLKALARRAAERAGLPLPWQGEIVDDHVPFLAEGWQAIDFIDFDYAPWHTAADTAEQLSAETLSWSLQLVRKLVALLEKESK
ncbi:MAG: M28 family peptidase [Candidatus Spyradenecus sp.]